MSKRQPDQAGTPADQARGPDERQMSGGMPRRPDDEELARRAEAERVDAGLEDYDPEAVPPATDTRQRRDVTDSRQYEGERAEVDKEKEQGELDSDRSAARKNAKNAKNAKDGDAYPPTRYQR